MNGEQVGDKKVRKPPVVMVGSSADNEIVVNSKYVSRRQLMLVEETKRESKTEKSNDHRHFFVICLSQTNFWQTAVDFSLIHCFRPCTATFSVSSVNLFPNQDL